MENEKKLNEINDEELTKISGGHGNIPGKILEEQRKVLEKIRKYGNYRSWKKYFNFAYIRSIYYSDGLAKIVFNEYHFIDSNNYRLIFPGYKMNADVFGDEFDIDNEITNLPWC